MVYVTKVCSVSLERIKLNESYLVKLLPIWKDPTLDAANQCKYYQDFRAQSFLIFLSPKSRNRIPLFRSIYVLRSKKSEASKCIQQMCLSRVNSTPSFCSCSKKRQLCNSEKYILAIFLSSIFFRLLKTNPCSLQDIPFTNNLKC